MRIAQQRLLIVLSVVIWIAILSVGQPWFMLLGFLFLWLLNCWFGARITGWSKLAEAYSTRVSVRGRCRFLQSVRFNRVINYRGIVSFCTNEAGVKFSVLFPFRFAHPSVFVPWDEMVGEEEIHTVFEDLQIQGRLMIRGDNLTYRTVRLRFSKEPSVIFEIRTELAQRLERSSGGAWSYQRA